MKTLLLSVVAVLVLSISFQPMLAAAESPPATSGKGTSPSDEKVMIPKADLLKLLLQRQRAMDVARRLYTQDQVLQEENRQLRLLIDRLGTEGAKCKSL